MQKWVSKTHTPHSQMHHHSRTHCHTPSHSHAPHGHNHDSDVRTYRISMPRGPIGLDPKRFECRCRCFTICSI